MLNIISILIGIMSLALGIITLLPILALANYILIVIPIIGAGIGFLSKSKTGRNLNIFVIVLMVVRLMLTGGLF